MTTLNLISKSGTAFEITADLNGVYAQAKGVNIGAMRIVNEGKIEAARPQNLGGKSVRIGAEFDTAEWEQIKPLFEAVERHAKESVASAIAYNDHTARIYGTD